MSMSDSRSMHYIHNVALATLPVIQQIVSGIASSLIVAALNSAEHSGRAVEGMNCLRPLKHWNRGFDPT
jgi:hypothetical protein